MRRIIGEGKSGRILERKERPGQSLIVGFVASIVTALAMSKCIVKTEKRYERIIWLFS